MVKFASSQLEFPCNGTPGSLSVQVSGSWDEWSVPLDLTYNSVKEKYCITLPENIISEKIVFKFIVNDIWQTSDLYETEVDQSGNINNIKCFTPIVEEVKSSPTTSPNIVQLPHQVFDQVISNNPVVKVKEEPCKSAKEDFSDKLNVSHIAASQPIVNAVTSSIEVALVKEQSSKEGSADDKHTGGSPVIPEVKDEGAAAPVLSENGTTSNFYEEPSDQGVTLIRVPTGVHEQPSTSDNAIFKQDSKINVENEEIPKEKLSFFRKFKKIFKFGLFAHCCTTSSAA